MDLCVAYDTMANTNANTMATMANTNTNMATMANTNTNMATMANTNTNMANNIYRLSSMAKFLHLLHRESNIYLLHSKQAMLCKSNVFKAKWQYCLEWTNLCLGRHAYRHGHNRVSKRNEDSDCRCMDDQRRV